MKKTNIIIILAIGLLFCVSILTNIAKAAYTADLNGDSQINGTDFSILKADFLKLTASLANPKSDIDGDGQATIKDVGIMMSGWGTVSPAPPSVSFNTYILTKPIASAPILPTTAMSDPSSSITLQAAKDQYQSASFVVKSTQDLTNFIATPSALTSGSKTIPASAVDIRVVKDWFQSGAPADEARMAGVRNLTPELLLHNDNLIRVDTAGKNNYLQLPGGGELNISTDNQATPEKIQPTDTVALQPLNIPANSNKQFWITLHVPSNAAAGTYTGTIALSGTDTGTVNLNISLTVSNFTLEQPNLMYGMYYSGKTTAGYPADSTDTYPNGTIGSIYKSVTQYTAELQGMLQHGIKYPSLDMFLFYGWETYPNGLHDLKLRKSLGFPTDHLFWTTAGGWETIPTTPAELDALQAQTVKYLSAAQIGGFDNLVVFGKDEVTPVNSLASEVPAFQRVRAAGAENVIADYNCYDPALQSPNLVGLIDFIIYPNAPKTWLHSTEAAANWKAAGAKILDYGHPYSEDPLVARRRFGWALYKAGFEGNFDFAYQAYYGSNENSGVIWNDFSIPVGELRTQILAYPTTNGMVDTVQYEGLREAINDMRYLATLQKAIKDHPGTAATTAQSWINSVDPNGDLDTYRQTMANYINQLVP